MDIAIIGWVWLGILIGVIAGFVLCSWLTSSKVSEMDAEISHQKFVRDSLKRRYLDWIIKPNQTS